ncbi:hypothetical protein PBI_TURJ99_84 [Mycobacterium phage Turj99]|uniref:hypothetical protein n=1 Tax=Mycobacterium phage Turj99 TaxID=1701849 RepID=UPI0006CE36C1|nr:hypothetical protein PBI_TURJ99_84 [Mycobacterium phage Turj99]ALF02678.1 hypothetical protein PBI_TURJ99_84 [Mycobacterium phage Turj99]
MRTIHTTPAEFRRENREAANSECIHGVRVSDCAECVRYRGECDMGGCRRKSVTVAKNGPERRPVCRRCIPFAKSLGMVI